jgi:hypothetical protein
MLGNVKFHVGVFLVRTVFLEWLRPPLFPRTCRVTLQTPWHPILRAAPLERSIVLPLMKGPRSLILTTTDLPLWVTRTIVPIGNVLCAAVIPHGLNFSPDAVILLLLHSPGFTQSYHDAKVALAGVTHAARAAMATAARILLVIALSYLCSVHQFGPNVHS